jgi:membrane protease YdiL (CAAX protease family)
MIGPILLALSWLLLRLEGKRLDAIGIDQPRRRLREFLVGVGLFGAVAVIQQVGLSLAADDLFIPNRSLQGPQLVEGLRFVVNSVLYEELLFRGYLLYQAARRLGTTRAALLSATAFGIYHWFSYGVLGQPVPMAYVFLLTGAFGYVWARAFLATGSVLAPIGMHFGWNAVSYLVFSTGPLGAGLLVLRSGNTTPAVDDGTALLLNAGLPLLAAIVILAYLRQRERRQGAGDR